MKTEEAKCWGLRVGGSKPYLGYVVAMEKEGIELSEPYHKAVKVVIIPIAEWRRLKKPDSNA